MRQLREERKQIVASLKSYSAAVNPVPSSLPKERSLPRKTMRSIVVYDVFISHATEDKADLVNELVSELKQRNVKIWVDALNIKWGDSLRKAIDEGLQKSRFGIVVISKYYIAKGWTQYELDGLFEKEMTGGKVVLPIWHNITKKEVLDFSPALAGRKALTTASMTPSDIADEVLSLLKDAERSAK